MSSQNKIELAQMLVTKVPQEIIETPYLSVPGWDYLNGRNGYCRDSIRAKCDSLAKADENGIVPYRGYDEPLSVFPYSSHLQALNLKPEAPWLLVGVRNLGNNLRIVGYKSDKNESQRLFQLSCENAHKNDAVEYSCLCMKEGKLSIERLKFLNKIPSVNGISWAFSGQELLWDGKPISTDNEVINKVLPYTYDLRHIWRDEKADNIEQNPKWMHPMVDAFVENLHKSPKDLSDAIISIKEELESKKLFVLKRECHYLHSAIGVSEDGKNIIIVQRHGKLEDVAKTLKDAGANRAIELDQGGSCCVMMRGDKDFTSGRIIFASHYFRPRAIALLVFKLIDVKIIENSCLL